MITQEALIQRRQRRKRQKIDQLTLTLPIEQELSRSLHAEHYQALSALRQPIACAIQAMRYEVYDIADEQCDTIVAAFQDLLFAVRNCITALNGPSLAAEMRPYPVIVKLLVLHRILIEAQVIVGNVRGQCRCGRLAADPCGSYWHLRVYLHDVVRDYRSLLGLLKQGHNTIAQPYTSATA